MRLFIFFNQAGMPQFVRDDAETASWTVEEMSMVATFPYNPDKVLERGMRVGFEDALNILQPFEIRKVETLEPDHYQRITCEHIVISELTDCHMQEQELTNVTAQAALTGILTGTGWSVGTVTASGTSSADLAIGSVWQNVRTIEQNWNVYITPRVTFSNSGITGKYLDISPAQGTWNGIFLSLDKNMDEAGVVIDDTDVKTALFGYGAAEDGVPLTFENVAWQATSSHPAKPQGQKFIEDPNATAAYGRNGTARFGFYQNTDITDPNVLLQKTWEVLKTTNTPKVTVNCMVRDLYRLGYNDQPIRLHDTARVEIRDTGTKLELEIIQLIVDLLDPTATRPTIGAYRPNIVYIQRQTAMNAAGGAANTSSGRRGGGRSGGGTALDEKLKEFETDIVWNDYQIGLRAYQRDMDDQTGKLLKAYAAIGISSDSIDEIVAGSGVMLDEYGNIITDANGNPVFQQGADPMWTRVNQTAEEITQVAEKTGINRLGQEETLFSKISQTAEAITAEVTRATGAESTLSSQLTITAGMIQTEVTNRQNADNTMSSRITQTANAITAEVSRATSAEGNLSSRITVNANGIETKVSKNGVISAINQTAESITIQASKINLSGYTTASQFQAEQARLTNVITGQQRVTYLDALQLQADQSRLGTVTVERGLTYAGYGDLAGLIIKQFGAAVESSGVLTIPSTTLNNSAGPSFSFNITDTATYKAAAVSRVSVSLTGTPALDNTDHYTQSGTAVLTKQNGTTQSIGVSGILVDSAVSYGETQGKNSVTINKSAWSNGVCTFTKSSGTASTKSVSLAQGTTTWGENNYANVAYVPVLDSSTATGLTISINAVSRYTAGQNSVTINKSAWANGVCTFTKSAGTASTKTVSLVQDETTTWGENNYANVAYVKVLDSSAETGLTISINAVSRYNAGRDSVTTITAAGVAPSGSITISGGTVTQNATVTVTMGNGKQASKSSVPVDMTTAYNEGWTAGYSAAGTYTLASYAKKGLTGYNTSSKVTLYYYERNTYYSAGTYYWYHAGTNGWDTLYERS